MEFQEAAAWINQRCDEIFAHQEVYEVDIDGDALYAAYLAAFPEGEDKLFRERTQHDCSTCRNFIRHVGGVVALVEDGDDFKVATIWDVDLPGTYGVVFRAMDEKVRAAALRGVFRTDRGKAGNKSNVEETEQGPITWHHFWADIPRRFVVHVARGAARGRVATRHGVLTRGLDQFDLGTLDTVLDLIDGDLYRGQEFRSSVALFRALVVATSKLTPETRERFAWKAAAEGRSSLPMFRNSVIGTLCVDIAEGVDITQAVARFESKVAPQNYRRTSSVITPAMVESALTKLRDLGLETAVQRRFARFDDVSVNAVLFVDNAVRDRMLHADPLADLLADVVQAPKVSTKGAIDIDRERFLSDVIPGATAVEMLVKNEHTPFLASLTAPVHADAGRLFPWSSGLAWSYTGDVADSIKERVKRAGGNIDALLRVSLSWFNGDDLDVFCDMPNGWHVYYGNKAGILDVDMNAGGAHSRNAVENLAWQRHNLPDGIYKIGVHNFTKRENIDVGFVIEYEHKGDVRRWAHPTALSHKKRVHCLTLEVRGGTVVSIDSPLEDTQGPSTEKWGIKTGQYVPVESILTSPNHWGDNAHGNLHHFFILRGCVNDSNPRGFFLEQLRSDLNPHRKVFEHLGSKLRCADSPDQLSGVGFSSTRRASATFRVRKGATLRTYNVQF